MTGLDPESDELIELFCIITDGDLNFIDEEGINIVVHQPKERMDEMGEWCTQTHEHNGLTNDVISSRVSPEEAAETLYSYIKKHIPEPGMGVLAGSCVYFDATFLRKEPYKKIIDHLDYRILDVQSLKEATKRWCPP